MATFAFTPAARADLDDIWDYTEATWGRAQAESYVRAIANLCAGLADGTRMSQSANAIRAGYRKAKVGKHVLFFHDVGGILTVVRILHQRMDVETQLY